MRERFRLLLSPLLLIAGYASGVFAQPPKPEQPPWADPATMFQRFFGGDEQADAKLLDKIEVTAREEQQIGKQSLDAYIDTLRRQGIRVVNRGPEVTYLRQLVDKVHPMMERRKRYPRIHVYYALTDHCDAKSFPGGYLVFFRGLLETTDNEAALIGMVGHELSHLDRGHHTRRIKEWRLSQQSFGGRSGPMAMQDFAATGGAILRSWLRPFRPEYEREADLDGARWSYRAGYDCRELAKLFLEMHHRRQNRRVPLPPFLQSHPADLDRHQAILDEYDELRVAAPAAGLHIGVENLRNRTAWVPGRN